MKALLRRLLSANRRAALRHLLKGTKPSARVVMKTAEEPRATSLTKTYPKRFRATPLPVPIEPNWPEPPITVRIGDLVREPAEVVQDTYDPGARATRYDVELFEMLNKEYESKPVEPAPPAYDEKSLMEMAQRHVDWAHGMIDLRDMRVLEIGCGLGFEVWLMANHLGADATGVDVVERAVWGDLTGERAHFACLDIAEQNPFPENHFERIVSFAVWEHVTHPYKALQETFRIMKPGGLQFLRANLHRGALASHLYHDIYFPWPHLLFAEDVFEEYYRRVGKPELRPAWVNRLTWTQYERYIEMAGFEICMLDFTERALDEDFYRRFEDVLGRYPKWDLTKEFFTAVLRKPG